MDFQLLEIVSLEACYVSDLMEIEQEWNAVPWSRESFLKEIQQESGFFRLVLLKKRPIAYGAMRLIGNEAHLTTFAVKRAYQRSGIGSFSLNKMLLEAKKKEATLVTLEVREGNQAGQKLYSKFGFAPIGRRLKYYSDNQEDALIMTLFHLDLWESPYSVEESGKK